jgi:hypothetical protein
VSRWGDKRLAEIRPDLPRRGDKAASPRGSTIGFLAWFRWQIVVSDLFLGNGDALELQLDIVIKMSSELLLQRDID